MTNYLYPAFGAGGSGTINNGTPPHHAYYSGVNTIDSDGNMRKGTYGTELTGIDYLLANGVTYRYYVDPAGNDANPGTLAQPFQTIGRGIRQWIGNIRAGSCILNLGAGTYNEQTMIPAFMADFEDVDAGQCVLKIVGDAATPSNVVINNNGGGVIWHSTPSTTLWMDGVTITSDNLGVGSYGLTINNSYCVLENVDFVDNRNNILVTNGGTLVWRNNANGGNLTALEDVITIDGGYASIQTILTTTGNRESAFKVNNGYVEFKFNGTTLNASGTSCDSHFKITNGGIVKLRDGMTLNLSEANSGGSAASFKVGAGCVFEMGATTTVNITNCTNAGILTENAVWKNGNACTFNYLGTTNNNWYINNNSTVINSDVFSGATLLNTDTTGDNYGLDWRFKEIISAQHVGALPVGATNFMTGYQVSASNMPLYLAFANEIIDSFAVRSNSTNGAGHTDTYTIHKNGIATGMTISLTNSGSGFTTSNPVTLASGDEVSIEVVSDAATTAGNILCQFSVRKLPT